MKQKISLVLGTGGSKGLAYIGVIRAIEEKGWIIDEIIGASAGALIGGLYAVDPNCDRLEKLINDVGYRDLFKIMVDFPDKKGLIRGKRVKDYITRLCGSKKIEDLTIKFRAVTTDIIEGKSYIFDSGDLATAIRASISFPPFFSPVRLDNKLLIDGGALNPVPVSEVKRKEGQKIVAVGLFSKIFPKDIKEMMGANLIRVSYVSMQSMVVRLSYLTMEKADIKILPQVSDINVLDFVKAKEYIEIGYEEAKKVLRDF